MKDDLHSSIAGYAVEIYNLMVKQDIIPATGKTTLTTDLITNILRIERELFPTESKEITLMNEITDSTNAASIIFASYAKWMPKEVEVTPEFIDKVITDKMDYALNAIAQMMQKTEGAEEQKNQKNRESASHNLMMTANRMEAEGNDADALSLLDQAIECRDNIEPIIRRGVYFHERDKIEPAIGDFTFAIDDARKTEHRLAYAYAERGLVNIEISSIAEGLDDLIRAFELFDKQLRTKPKMDESEDTYIGTIEYFMEQCAPAIKTIKASEKLSVDEEAKLKTLDDLIVSVKEEIEA